MIQLKYRNNSCNMVVLRCIGADNFFLERVLFPAELIVLTVPEDSKLEIWGHEMYGPNLEQRLRINSQNETYALAT